MYRSEIAGQTDFLYGFGTAWIQSSRLALRGCGGGICRVEGDKRLAECTAKADTDEGNRHPFQKQIRRLCGRVGGPKGQFLAVNQGQMLLGKAMGKSPSIESCIKDLTRQLAEFQAPLNIHQNLPGRLDPLLGIHELERE